MSGGPRRPLAPSRAAIAAALLPSDADRTAFYYLIATHPGIIAEQRRLDAAKQAGDKLEVAYSQKRAFTHNPTPAEIAWFQQNLAVPNPVILDVTAGGGSLPFEAGRLGLPMIAHELNPVATLILQATCQWPQQYGNDLLAAYQQVSARFRNRVRELMAGVYPQVEPLRDDEIPEKFFRESCDTKETSKRLSGVARLSVPPVNGKYPYPPTGGWTPKVPVSGCGRTPRRESANSKS